jgi:hypothetical protein
LGLPVVHILEADVKGQVDDGVYDEQVGLLEMTLDVERVREAAGKFPGRLGTRPQRPASASLSPASSAMKRTKNTVNMAKKTTDSLTAMAMPASCWSASGVSPQSRGAST